MEEKYLKKRKSYITGILVVAVIMIGIAAIIMYRIQATLPIDPESLYIRQYKRNKQLRQEVKDFVTPRNMEALFKQHEEVLESFAEKCYEYRNTGKRKSIDVSYIDDERYYFSVWEHKNNDTPNRKKENAVKEGEYSYITEFMEYAIENKLVFRDWMLSVTTPEPVNEDEWRERNKENQGTLLVITIYRGVYAGAYDGTYAGDREATWLELHLIYSPYSDIDYSYEYMNMLGVRWMHEKKVQITPNWYYSYMARY